MKYFTFKELCHSNKAIVLKIDNTPTQEVKENLAKVVDNILDKAREALGKPIHVTSGYRCLQLNRAVGGVATSQHIKGEAVDIQLGGRTIAENRSLFEYIRDNCEYDQLINEHNYAWVHLSFSEGNNRNRNFKL